MKNNSKLREEKFMLVRQWESSGLSQREFSKQENISYQNLNNWIKVFRKQNTELPKAGFIKIAVAENKISSETIFSEITFANGNRIKFYNVIEISDLKQLAG